MLRDCEGGPRMSDSGTWYITPAPICGMPLVRAPPSQGGVEARIYYKPWRLRPDAAPAPSELNRFAVVRIEHPAVCQRSLERGS
jgi:hypothetical protein